MRNLLTIGGALVVFAVLQPVGAQPPQAFSAAISPSAPASAALWSDRGNLRSLNLLYGAGGKEHAPAGKFTFLKDDPGGTSPKFEVVDEQGVHWKAKLGEEAQSETAATRLLWAAGYFTDEDYYLPELKVENLPKKSRGGRYVSAGNLVRGVRLERSVKGQKKNGNWSWFKNPMEGTRELSGLRVMMALMNNWDLKTVNNDLYAKEGEGSRYVVTDLGATFGRTGNTMVRSKNNLREYSASKFVKTVKPEYVDFHMNSRPFFLQAVNVPYYVSRTRMQGVVKHIPRTHAKWLGQLLGQLSADQIRDCFRAAGYSPAEVEGFTKTVQGRIAELNQL